MRVLVVGAGFSGAVIARELAEAGHQVVVIDERTVLGGNCATARDGVSGIMVHLHGPHVFHTDDERVWAHIGRFAEMVPYRHRVRAMVGGQVYSMPINLHTINQFFGRALSPGQARMFIEMQSIQVANGAPRTLEEFGLSAMGAQLYRAFVADYTRKQWGVDPSLLPADVLKRLPLRFNYDDSYFFHRHQAIPRDGYSAAVEAMLRHPAIRVILGLSFEASSEAGLGQFDHVVYSGPIDRYHGLAHGALSYRTLDFETFHHEGDYQGVAVMNYCDAEVPHTRITEHRHFTPWEQAARGLSVCFREYSRTCGASDVPYYPLRLAEDRRRLALYVERSRQLAGVTFVGRLGTYSYMDMDVAIGRALETADALKRAFAEGVPAPVFVHEPQ
ncbi:UDP-galactopyranose/dTDP-fucopyranose mutase family protein [Tabrizicola sp. M-4]|uniref:UDP-galactopyranose/dTDP-fucopyranose mutase family protein n=1 Tax=Tabrizicola sp. M-4 TaxID=3055847 RepID=UPI003DA859B2